MDYIKGNLFEAPMEYALAHCISADVQMGAGIALQFAQKYPDMKRNILSRNPQVGGVYDYTAPDGRRIYNLVTKPRYFHKPTYHTLGCSIDSMSVLMKLSDDLNLAIPKLGCGLDRLSWDKVSHIIQEYVIEFGIDVQVYEL